MASDTSGTGAQIVYFSHGGGPLPILGDPGHRAMLTFMTELPDQLRRPDLILVVSAHWEERAATVMTAEKPKMFYDYYGFPAQAYSIQYPAPGSPSLAEKVTACLDVAGIPSAADPQRGFDHGLFIPLKMMYPDAAIPAIQLSLLRGLSAPAHIALGKALRGLRDLNVLVIGSGFSFHNLNAFFGQGGGPDAANDAFQDWLIETACADMPQTAREERLVNWAAAPNARYCHPREEHLLPLHVCAAMADGPGKLVFDDEIMGKRSVAFAWS